MGLLSLQHLPLLEGPLRRPPLVLGRHVFPAIFSLDKGLSAGDAGPRPQGHLEVGPQQVFPQVGPGRKVSVAAGAGVLGPPLGAGD